MPHSLGKRAHLFTRITAARFAHIIAAGHAAAQG
jgi:hypothetical protein